MFRTTYEYISALISSMNQDVIIGFMLIAALGYLVNVFWTRMRRPSHACGEGCKTCSVVDHINKI